MTLREEEGYASLRVEDDGPGIPPEDRDRVFARFATLDDARSVSGTGLGLAIARDIALRHDGALTALDSPTGGAAFDVRIPVAS